jgi:hypothetical protein
LGRFLKHNNEQGIGLKIPPEEKMKSIKTLVVGSLLILFLVPAVLAQDNLRPRRLYDRIYIDEKGKVLKTERILPQEGVAYPTRDEYIVIPKGKIGKMKIKASNGGSPAGQAVRGTGNVVKGVGQVGAATVRTGWRIVKAPFHKRRDRVIYQQQLQ